MIFSRAFFSWFFMFLLAFVLFVVSLLFIGGGEAVEPFALKYKNLLVQEGAILESMEKSESLVYGEDLVELAPFTKVKVIRLSEASSRFELLQGSVTRLRYAGLYRFEWNFNDGLLPDLLSLRTLKKEKELLSVEGGAFMLYRDELYFWEQTKLSTASGLDKTLYAVQAPKSLAFLEEKLARKPSWTSYFNWSDLRKQEDKAREGLLPWYEALSQKNAKLLFASDSLKTEEAQALRWWIYTMPGFDFQQQIVTHPAFASLFGEDVHRWLYLAMLQEKIAPADEALSLQLHQLKDLFEVSFDVDASFFRSYSQGLDSFPVYSWGEEALKTWNSFLVLANEEPDLRALFLQEHEKLLQAFQLYLKKNPQDEGRLASYTNQVKILDEVFQLEDALLQAYEVFPMLMQSDEILLYPDYEEASSQWSRKMKLEGLLNTYLQKWKSGELNPNLSPVGVRDESILSRLSDPSFESLTTKLLLDPEKRLLEVRFYVQKKQIHLKIDKQTALIYEIRIGQKRYPKPVLLEDFQAWWSKIGQDYL